MSKSAETEPEVILIDSPTKVSISLRQKLPNGYRWVTKEQVQRNYLEITDDMEKDLEELKDNPQIFFLLDEDLDMEEAIRYAKENGKTEIYLKAGKINPEEMVPLSMDEAYDIALKSINTTIAGIEWMLDPFFIKDAFASTVPAPNCSTGTAIMANTCIPIQSGFSTMDFCFKYATKSCHYYSWMQHASKNIDSNIDNGINVNNNTWVSFRTAMGYMGNPLQAISDLEVRIYLNSSASGFIAECGPNATACGHCDGGPGTGLICGMNNKPNPVPHIGDYIVVTDTARNNWGIIRHEVAHNYLYEHCEMDLDFDNVARSINSYGQGTTVPKPPAGCASIGRWTCVHNPNVCSAAGVLEFPNNIYY